MASGTSTAEAERQLESMSRIVLRPIASSMALGFLALGGATVALSGLQLGWYGPGETTAVALALVLFAFPLQLLAAGITGLVLLGFAYYAALALALEDVRRKTVLPVFRLGMGKESLRAPAATQVSGVEHEAGVRKQL